MSTSPNRMVGILFGVAYLLLGVFGFFTTSATGFAATEGPTLLGLFEVNPLHNLVHIVVGIALLLAGLTGAHSGRLVNLALGALFLLVGLVSLPLIFGSSPLNILAINSADTVLNFATAAVLIAVAMGSDHRVPSTSK